MSEVFHLRQSDVVPNKPMNTKPAIFAALFMLALAPSCTSFRGTDVELAKVTANHPGARKVLDARITRFRYQGGAFLGVDTLFNALKQQGYQESYFYDGEAALTRGVDNFVAI